ncbi:MAG: hypothetical protein HY547_10095 [Elusimicrobia bacterium]|nr:hypothetical protein [Elusimicrobiota bacterium]
MKSCFIFWSLFLALNSQLSTRNSYAASYSGGLPGAFIESASGARALAMGRAYGAIAQGTGGLIWNPAGLGMPYKSELSLNYVTLFEGASLQEVSFAHSGIAPVGIGFGAVMYGSPEVEERDATNTAGAVSNYSKSAYLLGLSWNPTPSWSLGVTGKMLNQEVAGLSASAGDVDIGMMLKFGVFQIGVQAQNLVQAELARDGGVDSLPTGGRAGAALKLFDSLLLSAEGAFSNETDMRIRGGLEYDLFHILAIRGGFDGEHPTAGIGFTFKDISLDYAALSHDDLGLSHRASLRLGFGLNEPDKIAARAKRAEEKRVEAQQARERRRQLAKERLAEEEKRRQAEAQAKQDAQAGPVVEKDNEIPIPEGRKLQVAVIDFVGQGVSEIEANAVTEFFRNAVVNANAFRMVDRGNMEKILTEQKFQQTGCTTEECAVQIGKILNVEWMFSGSVSFLSDTYYLTVRLMEVQTSELIASRGSEAKSVSGLKSAANNVAQRFIKSLKPVKPESKPETPPSGPPQQH